MHRAVVQSSALEYWETGEEKEGKNQERKEQYVGGMLGFPDNVKLAISLSN